jgi:hypothetical protein
MYITGGTVEGNATPGFIGALIEGYWNKLDTTDFEANGSNTDIQISNKENFLTNVLSGNFTHIVAGASNQISGGSYHNLTIDPFVHQTILSGIEWTGVLTDLDTQISTIKFGNVGPSTQGGLRYDSQIGNVVPNMLQPSFTGGIIGTDCLRASNFYIAVFSDVILGNPINPVNGQKITWRIQQGACCGGAHNISYGSKFRPRADGTFPTLINAPVSFTYITAIYNSTLGSWDIQ